MDSKKPGIYKILNSISGDFYIGKSLFPERRWKQHLSELRQNHHHNSNLQDAFISVGEINIEFTMILFCNKELLTYFESSLIRSLKPKYNIVTDSYTSPGPPKDYTGITLISPSGEVFTNIHNQSKFFSDRGYSTNILSQLLTRKYLKKINGWYLLPENYKEEPDYVYNFSDIEDEVYMITA